MIGSLNDTGDHAAPVFRLHIFAVAEDHSALADLHRRLEYLELDAIGLGFLHFQRIGRHVLEGLAVVHPGFAALAHGCTAGIHCHVAAADHNHFLTQIEGRRILQERQCLHGLFLAGDVQGGRFFGPGAQDYGVVIGHQVRERTVAAQFIPALEFDAGGS